MKYFLVALLALSACKKHADPPTPRKGFSLVKLFLKSRDSLSSESREKDLALMVRRIITSTHYTAAKVRYKPELHIEISVSNDEEKRSFLKVITPLIKYEGVITLQSVAPWPTELLNKKGPIPVHRVTLHGMELFRSVNRALLEDYLSGLGTTYRLHRIPKGTYDFPKSYWVAYHTVNELHATTSKEGMVTIPPAQGNQKNWVAVMLDSYILQLVEKPGIIAPVDETGTIKPKQIRALITIGPLSSPWRIARIEASQNL